MARLFRSAREVGPLLRTVGSGWREGLELDAPERSLFIEPEEELRRIVAAEIGRAVTFPVQSCGLQDCPKTLDGAIPVVLPNRAAVRQALPEGIDVLTLHFRSVPTSLAGWLPAPSGTLIGIASGWPDFLKLARTLLNSPGFPPDALIFRDARKANWQPGLTQTVAVGCGSRSAREPPATC